MANNMGSVATGLDDIIIERIVSVVSSPLAFKRIEVASTYRVSCEGWLKLELLHDFSDFFAGGVEIQPESGSGRLTPI
jgi:hypothetical protein